jgi:hypothetical protein
LGTRGGSRAGARFGVKGSPRLKGQSRIGQVMLYMVVEKFKEGVAPEIYRRARAKGRLLPDGLSYVSSWVDMEFKRCFQLMETDDPSLFPTWIREWTDLAEFEIIPVRTSAEAARVIDTET